MGEQTFIGRVDDFGEGVHQLLIPLLLIERR